MRIVQWLVGLGVVVTLAGCSMKASEPPDPLDGNKDKAPNPAADPTVELERYPRMVMPGEVVKDKSVTVFVGLRETPGASGQAVVVGDGEGSLTLELPELAADATSWAIDVILSAPDFTIDGDDFRTLQLPEEGPSTMARYDITLTRVPASGTADVQAYLFHDGAFMGQIGRTVQAVEAASTASSETTESVATSVAGMKTVGSSHEIHLLALDDERALVVVNEPGKTMEHTVVAFDRTRLPDFLGPKFAAIRSRGLERVGADPVAIDMLRGLGTQLWEFTPAPVRAHLLETYGRTEVDALRIYTNLPGFPWELVRPVDGEGTAMEPLGTRFRLGRWHLRMGMSGLATPPTRIDYRELVAMVPEYEGDAALPAVERELKALQAVSGFRRIPGVAASMKAVVSDPPNGVLHFAGHGDATETDGASSRFALRLEDGAFDSTAFVGIDGKKLRERQTLVFFNACELGQADTAANVVEGWAPVMLDAGASGYIGALWPVGDDEAAAFAEAFYDEVERSITRSGGARVTEILRCLREKGVAAQDPTWQAYVFYGDPDTMLLRDDVEPTDPDGTYRCE
ncbi:MAG: CHAT domain-containing protein [Myxococcota bacterium]